MLALFVLIGELINLLVLDFQWDQNPTANFHHEKKLKPTKLQELNKGTNKEALVVIYNNLKLKITKSTRQKPCKHHTISLRR